MLSILLFHVRLLHIYCFLSITYICICIVPFSNGTNPGWRSEHAGAMQLILLPYGPPLDAGVNLAVWPRNAGRGEGWKLGPLCPTMMWNSPPKTHIDCDIYILLYHLYRIWRSNTFSVGLQLYHPISCSSYLHNTFYCFPREKHFAFQSSWQVARHGSFAAVTEQDALTETSARSPGEDEHFGWLVISKFIQFHDLYSLIYPCVDDSCVMYVHLISTH